VQMKNVLKEALLERKLTMGSWIQIGSADVAEILAEVGYDWLAVDIEHTDIGMDRFSDIARAMKGKNCVPLARVNENSTMAIRKVLDLGAMGVIVPLVNNAADAKKAVHSAKYPPDGVRGYAFCRANQWGENFNDYVKQINDCVCVIVMIESEEAVENIDEILAVEGVDGVFIGPYDMSGSYGIPGQTSHKIICDACDRVVAACKAHGKSAGLHVVIPTNDAVAGAIKKGFTFIALGIDSVFISTEGRKVLETARNAVSTCPAKENEAWL